VLIDDLFLLRVGVEVEVKMSEDFTNLYSCKDLQLRVIEKNVDASDLEDEEAIVL